MKKKRCDHCNRLRKCIKINEYICKECVDIYNDKTRNDLKIEWSEYEKE